MFFEILFILDLLSLILNLKSNNMIIWSEFLISKVNFWKSPFP